MAGIDDSYKKWKKRYKPVASAVRADRALDAGYKALGLFLANRNRRELLDQRRTEQASLDDYRRSSLDMQAKSAGLREREVDVREKDAASLRDYRAASTQEVKRKAAAEEREIERQGLRYEDLIGSFEHPEVSGAWSSMYPGVDPRSLPREAFFESYDGMMDASRSIWSKTKESDISEEEKNAEAARQRRGASSEKATEIGEDLASWRAAGNALRTKLGVTEEEFDALDPATVIDDYFVPGAPEGTATIGEFRLRGEQLMGRGKVWQGAGTPMAASAATRFDQGEVDDANAARQMNARVQQLVALAVDDPEAYELALEGLPPELQQRVAPLVAEARQEDAAAREKAAEDERVGVLMTGIGTGKPTVEGIEHALSDPAALGRLKAEWQVGGTDEEFRGELEAFLRDPIEWRANRPETGVDVQRAGDYADVGGRALPQSPRTQIKPRLEGSPAYGQAIEKWAATQAQAPQPGMGPPMMQQQPAPAAQPQMAPQQAPPQGGVATPEQINVERQDKLLQIVGPAVDAQEFQRLPPVLQQALQGQPGPEFRQVPIEQVIMLLLPAISPNELQRMPPEIQQGFQEMQQRAPQGASGYAGVR
jgi:hypothetical protein